MWILRKLANLSLNILDFIVTFLFNELEYRCFHVFTSWFCPYGDFRENIRNNCVLVGIIKFLLGDFIFIKVMNPHMIKKLLIIKSVVFHYQISDIKYKNTKQELGIELCWALRIFIEQSFDLIIELNQRHFRPTFLVISEQIYTLQRKSSSLCISWMIIKHTKYSMVHMLDQIIHFLRHLFSWEHIRLVLHLINLHLQISNSHLISRVHSQL